MGEEQKEIYFWQQRFYCLRCLSLAKVTTEFVKCASPRFFKPLLGKCGSQLAERSEKDCRNLEVKGEEEQESGCSLKITKSAFSSFKTVIQLFIPLYKIYIL